MQTLPISLHCMCRHGDDRQVRMCPHLLRANALSCGNAIHLRYLSMRTNSNDAEKHSAQGGTHFNPLCDVRHCKLAPDVGF